MFFAINVIFHITYTFEMYGLSPNLFINEEIMLYENLEMKYTNEIINDISQIYTNFCILTFIFICILLSSEVCIGTERGLTQITLHEVLAKLQALSLRVHSSRCLASSFVI